MYRLRIKPNGKLPRVTSLPKEGRIPGKGRKRRRNVKSKSSLLLAFFLLFGSISYGQDADLPLPPGWLAPELHVPNNGFSISKSERDLVRAINTYRADRKLPALLVDPILMQVARLRVGTFNHNHPRYGWCKQHCSRLGFTGFATDNLALGHSDGPDAVRGWAMSDGHARQMRGQAKMNGRWIDYKFNRVGVAQRGKHFIAVFGVE